MASTRREFLRRSAALAALAALWPHRAWATPWQDAAITELMLRDTALATTRAARSMRVLVLGGTGFLGPATVEILRARGHEVTLFNRGRTNAHLYPELEKITGDRSEGHDALAGRTWDVVLDTSAYFPRVVHGAMDVLAGSVEHYLLISTISVYASFATPGIDETAPVATIEDESTEEVTGATYGALKALCEQAAEERMPGRTCVLRPGLIVGPMDRTDRFTYWPVRVSRGGEVLAPNAPTQNVQFVDVRDLAAFVVTCLEDRVIGTYNATSPTEAFTIGDVLDTSRTVTGSDARFTWVTPEFLEEHGVAPWSEMPVWLPPTGEYAGSDAIDVSRATAKGFAVRPLEQTVRATLDWWRTQPEVEEERRTDLRAGLSAEKERAVLEAWHARG